MNKQKLLQEMEVIISVGNKRYEVELTTAPTNFNGVRLYFLCPGCKRRAGCLYLIVGNPPLCRHCNSIKYPGSYKRRNELLLKALKLKKLDMKLSKKWLRQGKRSKLEAERRELLQSITNEAKKGGDAYET